MRAVCVCMCERVRVRVRLNIVNFEFRQAGNLNALKTLLQQCSSINISYL